MTASTPELLPDVVTAMLDALDAQPETAVRGEYADRRRGIHVMTDGDRTIVLLGVVHVTTLPTAHRIIRALDVAARAEWTLYNEGLQGDYKPSYAKTRDEDPEWRALMSRALDAGVAFQHQFIRPFGDRVVCADVTHGEMVARAPRLMQVLDELIDINERAVGAAIRTHTRKKPRKVRRYVVLHVMRHVRPLRDTAVGWRNQVFVDYLVQQPGNAVCVWGSAHGPGQVVLLEQAGFRRVGSWSHLVDDLDPSMERVIVPAGVEVREGEPRVVPLG